MAALEQHGAILRAKWKFIHSRLAPVNSVGQTATLVNTK